MKFVLLAIFCIASVICAETSGSSSSVSSASSGPREDKREIQVEFQKNSINIESKSKDVTSQTKLKFEVQSEGGLRMRLRYETVNKTSNAKIANSLRVRIVSLVEFDPSTLPAALNGAYDGSTAAVKTVTYAKTKADMVELPATVVDSTNSIRNFLWSVGPVNVTMHVSGVAVSKVGQAPITPGSLKFDFDVKGYNFAKSTNRLALLAMVDTSAKMEKKSKSTEETRGEGTNEGEINAGGSTFFSFANTAQCVNGPVINVATSPVAAPTASEDDDNTKENGEKTNRVFFTFLADAPSAICWDPKVGADIMDTTAPISSGASIAASLSALILAIIAIIAF